MRWRWSGRDFCLLHAHQSKRESERDQDLLKTTNLFVCLDNKLPQPPVSCRSGHSFVKGDDIDVENHLFCFCSSLLSHSCPRLYFLCLLPSCCLSFSHLYSVKSCCSRPFLFFVVLFLSPILFLFNPSPLVVLHELCPTCANLHSCACASTHICVCLASLLKSG